MTTLSIVIPAYNEASRIAESIRKIDSFLETRPWVQEVLFVVEPSKDGTLAVVQDRTRNNPKFRVITNEKHYGKGFAVKTGMLEAKSDWVLFSDADLSVSLEQIDILHAKIETSAAKAWIGTRYSKSVPLPRHVSLLRRLSSRVYKYLFLKWMGLHVSDSQCGFKAFERNTAREIFGGLETDGFAFDVEVILKLQAKRTAFEEFPVQWKDAGNSTFSLFRHGFQILGDLLKLKPVKPHGFTVTELFLPTALIAVGVFQTWYSMNPHSVDHQGHVTSAILFWKGYFHSFVDQLFLGYVQNLFYPPLNDFLLGLFFKISPFSIETTYPIYLSLCWIALILTGFRLSFLFQRFSLRMAFQLGAFILFVNSHTVTLNDQGLSIQDLLVFGLSPQLLSGTFLFLWIYEVFSQWMKDTQPSRAATIRLVVFTTVILLCHLVTAMIIVLFGAALWLTMKNRLRFFIACLVSFLIAFFFWGPFLIYKSEIVSASVFNDPRYGPLLFSIVALLMLRRWAFFAAVPGILVIATVLEPIRQNSFWDWEFPAFHYYRLSQYANWLQLFLSVWIFSEWAKTGKSKVLKTTAAVLLVFCFCIGKLPNPTFFFRAALPAKYDVQEFEKQLARVPDTFSRIWTKHLERSIDFVLDSIALRASDTARFTKGLFWESSTNNELLGDYLLSIEGEPHVLAGTIFPQLTLAEYACLQKMFIEDFSIHKILAPSPLTLSNSQSQMGDWVARNRMLNAASVEVIDKRMFAKDIGVDYSPQTPFSLGNANYRWYNVIAKDTNQIAVVEQLRGDVILKDFSNDMDTRHRLYQDMTRNRCGIAQGRRNFVVVDDQANGFFDKTSSTDLRPGMITKIAKNHYALTVRNDIDAPYLIKLNWTPFWKITQGDRTLSVYKSWPGMVSKWKGTVELEFTRSLWMKICYAISVLSVLACIAYLRIIGKKSSS